MFLDRVYSAVVAKRIQRSHQMSCGRDDCFNRTRCRNHKNKIDPAFPIYTTVLPSRHLYTAPRGPRLRSQTHPYTSYKLDLYMTSILCACSACWSSSLFYIMRIISLTQSKWLDRSYVRGGNRNTGQAAGVLRVVAVYTW
jgi:hypothetical protein